MGPWAAVLNWYGECYFNRWIPVLPARLSQSGSVVERELELYDAQWRCHRRRSQANPPPLLVDSSECDVALGSHRFPRHSGSAKEVHVRHDGACGTTGCIARRCPHRSEWGPL